MPKAARAKTPATPRTIEHLEEQVQIDNSMLEPSELEAPWQEKVKLYEADIWTAQELMPALLAKECLAYLYRLEPEVFNSAGKGSNIGKYQIPVTIEQITKAHGGGKYKLWIKRGPRNMVQEIFTINDAAPIFQSGQTLRDGKPIATPSNSEGNEGRGETAQVVKMLLDSQKQQPGATKAIEQAIEVLGTAQTTALKIQSDASAAAIASPTGNKLMDEVVPALLKRLMEPPPAAAPVDPLAVFERVANMFKAMQPAPAPVAENPEPANIMDQFALVKELTGAESLKDLITNGMGKSGPKAPDPWLGMIASVVPMLPQLVHQWRIMRDEDFRRQVWLSQNRGVLEAQPVPGATPANRQPVATRGAVVAFPGTPPPPPPAIDVQPPISQPAQPQTQEQLVMRIVQEIERYFKAGWDGEVTAIHLKMELPEAVVLLGPVLADQNAITQLVQGIPQLSALAQEEEWPQFLAEFIEQMQTEKAETENAGAEAAKPN